MNFSGFDHQCMAAALKLAASSLFSPHPNPRVGCVIADGQRIVGAGRHEFAGGPHAEVAALRDIQEPAKGFTAYVTLEPCAYHGRTPPCTDALLAAGISRVVVASTDPNPKVNGRGLEQLRSAGLLVESGLMEDEAEALNQGFFMRMRNGRPWVRVKAAISLDGRTALRNGDSKWISCEASRQDVQKWRARSSAILTGIGTVLADDPSMTVRLDDKDGQSPRQQPLRIIVDSRWRIPVDSLILADPATAIIVGNQDVVIPPDLKACGARIVSLAAISGKIDLASLLSYLAEIELNEVQVEAGSRLCGSLLKEMLVDEILIYQAPLFLGTGGPGPFNFGPLESMDDRTHLKWLETRPIGKDLRIRLAPEYGN